MDTCTALAVKNYCLTQTGTTEGKNNWNPYAQMLDAVNYFYPQKKQNVPWCCTYVDACIFVACGKNKAKADYALYQPATNNYSAVVSYLADYFKKNGAYFTDKNRVQVGDVIFFNTVDSKGKVTSKYSHTGLVIDRDSKGVTTSEGNKNNKVSICSYQFTSIGTKIEGFGRPRYIDPTPTPEPPTDFYKVHTQTGDTLRLRKEPTTKSAELAKIPNNTTIKVTEVVDGESIKGCKAWVKTTYNGFTGYASGAYLQPTPILPPSPTPTPPAPTGTKYRVKTNSGVALRLRAKPTTASTQIGYINNGQVVLVESIENGWGYVNRNGATGGGAQKGYGYMQYLKKI